MTVTNTVANHILQYFFLIKYTKKIIKTRNEIAGLFTPPLCEHTNSNVIYPNTDAITYDLSILLCK